MAILDLGLLTAVGVVAGIINTLAGGGSLLSVPLLVFLGLPGDVANGTNRVGVLVQSVSAAWRFRSEGVSGLSDALPVLAPIVLGSLLGAALIAQLAAEGFERLFGVAMLLLLVPTLRASRSSARRSAGQAPWGPRTRALVFFAIGLYGGAIQAGVGLVLVMALARAGYDLVRANSIKVVVVAALTAVAIPVFIVSDQVSWLPALYLVVGFAAGGAAGARLAVLGGERLIRPMLAVAVIALAGRMLALY